MEKINCEKVKAVKVGVQAINIQKGTSALKTEDDNQESSSSWEVEWERPKAQQFLEEREKYYEASQLVTVVSKTKAAMLSSINEVSKSNNFDSSEERLTVDAAESNKGEGITQAEIEKSRSEAVVPSLRQGDSTECFRKLQTGESTSKYVEQSSNIPESETSEFKGVKRKKRNRCQRPPRRIRIALREKALREGVNPSENLGSLTIKQGDNSSKNENLNSDLKVTEEIRSEGSEFLKKKAEPVKIPMAIVAPLTKEALLKSTCHMLKNESCLETTSFKNESGSVEQTTLKKKKKGKKNKTGLKRNPSIYNTNQPGNQRNLSKKQRAQVLRTQGFPNVFEMLSRTQNNMQPMQRSYLGVSPMFLLQNQHMLRNPALLSVVQKKLSQNHELPMMNQGHYSGNLGISPLMHSNPPAQNKIKRKKPKNRVDPLRNQSLLKNEVNLAQYHEYVGDHQQQEDQSRNQSSLLWNDANPPKNEGSFEKLHKSQSNIGNNQHYQGNLSGSQEYPSQFQMDLLARPSTSKIEVDSKDFHGSQECSVDLKRPTFFQEESIHQDLDLKRLIVAEDFGRTTVSSEELMLIRIAMSREISKIRKGPVPKFIDTQLTWYGIVVEFADTWSRDWLTDTICKIYPWSGARLRLIKVPCDEKLWKAKFDRSGYF